MLISAIGYVKIRSLDEVNCLIFKLLKPIKRKTFFRKVIRILISTKQTFTCSKST